MSGIKVSIGFVLVIVLAPFAFSRVQAQTTAFTYQGKLTDAGSPANGDYDLQFKLFDTAVVDTGLQQGPTVVRNPVTASNGAFTVLLDFAADVFSGADRFLEIGVRPANSTTAYTVLAPRQPVTASPYAIQTINAQKLGGLPASRYLTGDLNGNVGIGTANPLSKLTVQASGYGITQTDGTVTVGTFINPTGGWLGTKSNHPLNFFTNDSLPQMTLTTSGNVGIGLINPTARLHVLQSTPGTTAIYGESATGRGVWGISTSSRGVFGESTSSEGVFGISSSAAGIRGASTTNSGVYGESPVSSLTAAGVFGKGTGSGSIGVIGESNLANAVGVFGVSSGPAGVGVYGRNLSGGRALFVEGNAGQVRDRGGMVKAMVYVLENGNIARCYNSQLPDGGASLPPSGFTGCGFSSSRSCSGHFCSTDINFGFQVSDRFWSATIQSGDFPLVNRGINVNWFGPDPNQLSVWTFSSAEQQYTDIFSPFMLIVY